MSENTQPADGVETHGFQTEARQLLKLMIHSLYSNREIFLRELISNASDAIDKARFLSLTEPQHYQADTDYEIRIESDPEAAEIRITDNGVGMTRDEVIDNLGTIAKSGTADFLSRLTGDQKKDAQLIGQFGVGFYSAFIVAERVDVLTRGAGEATGTCWRSHGEDSYTVEDADDLPRGTTVILHLREDAKEFAEPFRLQTVVRKYSDHIAVPVRMKSAAPGDEGDSGDGDAPVFETVNAAKALWTRPRAEVEDDEYKEFYKHVSHDFEDPLTWSHNRVEGKLEYTSLLYVPRRAPFDLWNRDAARGLKLYVQRVFIMDEAEQFLPLYLRFMKGVVDSNDLPLNVSREILQQDERVTSIRNALTKRSLTMLADMAKQAPEDYAGFWDEFGDVLKEGVGEDFANREAVLKLLRFASTTAADSKPTVSLEQYCERMVDGQDAIYYLTAETFAHAASSPHLEVFRKRGIEVLLLSERIDEWMMSQLDAFDGKSFQDVSRGELDLPGTADSESTDESSDASENATADEAALAERIKSVLDDRVDKVRASKRLTESPACLALNENAMGAQMRRIMEAAGQSLPESKPDFEFNATHPLLQHMDQETDEDRFADLVHVLFDQACLAEGVPMDEPGAFNQRVNRLLLQLITS